MLTSLQWPQQNKAKSTDSSALPTDSQAQAQSVPKASYSFSLWLRLPVDNIKSYWLCYVKENAREECSGRTPYRELLPPWGTSSTYCQNVWYVAVELQRGERGGKRRAVPTACAGASRTEQKDGLILPTWQTDKRERREIVMWAIVRHTNIIGLSKSDWLSSMHLKTLQLSFSHLTSSVYSVDCSCLHLALISESRNQSFRTTENDVSADVRLFNCGNSRQTFLCTADFKLMDEFTDQCPHAVICDSICHCEIAGGTYRFHIAFTYFWNFPFATATACFPHWLFFQTET